jgi:hypothetical protein
MSYNASGQRIAETWSNGAMESWRYDPDSSYESLTTPPVGASYVLAADLYSAAKAVEVDAKDLANGSGALRIYADGATMAQSAGALSVTVGGDAFALDAHDTETMTATGASSESFAFASEFGHTSIAGFVVQGAGADKLGFQLSMFDQNWFTPGASQSQDAAALLLQATGTTNTVITDAQGDALTLLGVTSAMRSSLAGDIRFT